MGLGARPVLQAENAPMGERFPPGVPPIGFFALRVSPFRGRADDLLSSLASLLDGIRSKHPNLNSPRRVPDADLADENTLAGGVNPNPKSGGAAAPQEIVGVLRTGGIDNSFG